MRAYGPWVSKPMGRLRISKFALLFIFYSFVDWLFCAGCPFWVLNDHHDFKVTRHRLPHWGKGGLYYFVTWRMADSLPKAVLDKWKVEQSNWLRVHPKPWNAMTRIEFSNRFAEFMNPELDRGCGSCLLREKSLRDLLMATLLFHDERSYELLSFVIMPNHVHVLFRLNDGTDLSKTMQSIKRYSARQINEACKRQGRFWQPDYYDVIIRSAKQYWYVDNYIKKNPMSLPIDEYTYWKK